MKTDLIVWTFVIFTICLINNNGLVTNFIICFIKHILGSKNGYQGKAVDKDIVPYSITTIKTQ